MIDLKESWDDHLPLIEFAYNNSYQASIQMTPFEALYERKCRTPICWKNVGERRLLRPELVQVKTKKIKVIRERLFATQSRQKSYADHNKMKLEFHIGEHVFMKVSPSKDIMRFEKKGKSSPRFIK